MARTALMALTKNNFLKINERLAWPPKQNFHGSSQRGKEEGAGKCIEKCNTKQLDMMTSLRGSQLRYLQPATKQLSGNKFRMSPPVISPVVDRSLEEDCRMREECAQTSKGHSSSRKGKSQT